MPTTYTINDSLEQSTAKVERNKKSYARVYTIEASARVEEATVSEWVRVTSSKAYTIGVTTHPIDTTAVLQSVDVSKDSEDGKSWKAMFNFETPTFSGSLPSDPLARPVEIQWGSDKETISIFKDYSSTPKSIVASNGEPFDDLPQRDRALTTVTYTKNETPSFFHSTVLPLMAFDIVVNSASFTIDGVSVAAQYARLEIKNADKQIEGTTTFYRVQYYLTLRAGFTGYASDGWRERYLDRGHYHWDGSDWVPIRDKDGVVVQSSWPLNGSGVPLGTATAEPAVLGPFRLYPEVSFASIGFA